MAVLAACALDVPKAAVRSDRQRTTTVNTPQVSRPAVWQRDHPDLAYNDDVGRSITSRLEDRL